MQARLFSVTLAILVLAVLFGCGDDDDDAVIGSGNGSRSDFVGTWNQQSPGEGVTQSRWQFRGDGTWQWDFTIEHASAVTGVPDVSATVKFLGTYNVSGSSYTLVFDEIDIVKVNPPTAIAESQVKASLLYHL